MTGRTNDIPPDGRVAACVALGASLGDRDRSIRSALRALDGTPGVRMVAASSLHETVALTPAGEDPTAPAYLNAAALLETALGAGALLDALLAIERRLGRARQAGERWAPRVIDLDLLLYGDRVIDEPGLAVPHPRMHERWFVLAPLAEVAPDATHPTLGRTVRELLAALGGRFPPALPPGEGWRAERAGVRGSRRTAHGSGEPCHPGAGPPLSPSPPERGVASAASRVRGDRRTTTGGALPLSPRERGGERSEPG